MTMTSVSVWAASARGIPQLEVDLSTYCIQVNLVFPGGQIAADFADLHPFDNPGDSVNKIVLHAYSEDRA